MQIRTKHLIIGTVVFIAIGFGIMMAGLVYDIMYAGIPYQDPTPELAAEYAVSKTVADTLFLVGASVASLGSFFAIWAAGRTAWFLMKSPPKEDEDVRKK
jgi:hypothetical protein